MSEREHKLQSRYERLDDQITGLVLDSIVISPRSHGRLHMPGQFGSDSRPPRYELKINSTAPDNQGVYAEDCLLGSAERYVVTHDVWNYRDSAVFAELVQLGEG